MAYRHPFRPVGRKRPAAQAQSSQMTGTRVSSDFEQPSRLFLSFISIKDSLEMKGMQQVIKCECAIGAQGAESLCVAGGKPAGTSQAQEDFQRYPPAQSRRVVQGMADQSKNDDIYLCCLRYSLDTPSLQSPSSKTFSCPQRDLSLTSYHSLPSFHPWKQKVLSVSFGMISSRHLLFVEPCCLGPLGFDFFFPTSII